MGRGARTPGQGGTSLSQGPPAWPPQGPRVRGSSALCRPTGATDGAQRDAPMGSWGWICMPPLHLSTPWKGAWGARAMPRPLAERNAGTPLPSWGDALPPRPPGRRCSCPGSSRTRRWRRRPATAWATHTRYCRTMSVRRSTTSGTCSSPRSWPTGVHRGRGRSRPPPRALGGPQRPAGVLVRV